MESKYVTPSDLRAMADWLEAHSEVQIPSIDVTVWSFGGRTFQQAVAALGAFDKEYTDSFVRAVVRFGALRLVFSDWRETVCQKVQTGTRHVDARTIVTEEPEHDEPVYEWRCPESWLKPAETQEKEAAPDAEDAIGSTV